MTEQKIYLEWLKKASDDFEFAKLNLETEECIFYAHICFHFQQSAEKYLKAYIVYKGLDFRKIHDLTQLLKICINDEASFDKLGEECNFLTDFYIESRYPVHIDFSISKDEAKKAFGYANNIKKFVEVILDNDVEHEEKFDD